MLLCSILERLKVKASSVSSLCDMHYKACSSSSRLCGIRCTARSQHLCWAAQLAYEIQALVPQLQQHGLFHTVHWLHDTGRSTFMVLQLQQHGLFHTVHWLHDTGNATNHCVLDQCSRFHNCNNMACFTLYTGFMTLADQCSWFHNCNNMACFTLYTGFMTLAMPGIAVCWINQCSKTSAGRCTS